MKNSVCFNNCKASIQYFSSVNQYYCTGCGAIWRKEDTQNEGK